MRCASCGAEVSAAVFPGAHVRCACGADVVISAGDLSSAPLSPRAPASPRPARSPYRDGASPPAAPRPARAHREAPRKRPCPRCASALTGGDPRACATCGGVFITHDALAASVREADEARDGAFVATPPEKAPRSHDAAVRYLACPACAEIMNRTTFGERSGIVIDVCKQHGSWFDRGELDRALALVRGGGIERARRKHATRERPVSPAVMRARAELEVALMGEAARDAENVARATRIAHDGLGGSSEELLGLVFGLFD